MCPAAYSGAVTDWARFLPLSNRDRVDESSVSRNWSRATSVRVRNPRRAVVTARTLVAVDGEWQVGRGPALPATAASIVLFLAGRGGVPASVETPPEN